MVKPIPDGYQTVIPHLVVRGGNEAIDFYKNAFGAEEVMRMAMPDGKLMHGEIKIFGHMVFIGEECAEFGKLSPLSMPGSSVTIGLLVENADQVFEKAVKAGAEVAMPLENMFWGDRYGQLKDPFGHCWGVAQHIEDVTPEQCAQRAQEMFAAKA